MVRASHGVGALRTIGRVEHGFALLQTCQTRKACAKNIGFVDRPRSRNPPVVIAKLIEDSELVSYGIHTRPIRIHRYALCIRRTTRRASALSCARSESVHRL